jgi:hypothetical protein
MKIRKFNEDILSDKEFKLARKAKRKEKASEVKKMLDLIFIDLIDRGATSVCRMLVLPASTIGAMYYDYKILVEYNIRDDNSKQSLSKAAVAYSKVSDDLLNIEAYIKYIQNKFKTTVFMFDITQNFYTTKFSLSIDIDDEDIMKNN